MIDKYRENTCFLFIKVNHVCCVCVVVSRLVSDLAVHKTEKSLPSVCGTLNMLMRNTSQQSESISLLFNTII